VGKIDATNRTQYIAALRRRLAELEHDIYISDAMFAANPQRATVGDVELVRMRHLEAEALRVAIAELAADSERAIPTWLYFVLAIMVSVAVVLAAAAIWLR